MKTHVIFYSGGKSSFAVAEYVVENVCKEDEQVLLYFTDTLWEDEDVIRFLYEGADVLKLPMLVQSRGITPAQLMVNKRFLANNRVGLCSKELKMKVAMDYFKEGTKPEVEYWHNRHFLKEEDFLNGEITLYFGISFEEMHREGPIRANWKPFEVVMPLIDHFIEPNEILKKYGLIQPRQYDKGFSHANCKSRCVKAGQAHFLNLLKTDPKTFYELMEQEIIISEYIRYTKQPSIKSGKRPDYMYKDVYEFVSTGEKSPKIKHLLDTHMYRKKFLLGVDRKGRSIKKPYTFMKNLSLEELEKKPLQLDLFDWGACGCFVEFDKTPTDNHFIIPTSEFETEVATYI
ncbi:hypothetical protein AWH56_008985 [Anaerobacillus isosaccharinicus]|uniref:Phosphoadenosine phosphosulphate reductase domain-containing protein n=1 Tax=Anaerobacillus isosaccharinicus TaxID=1532552 RepID=A0A1S2MB41_9BACI|nr:hypothetical protein [Anaerobacillus isosaccharinicus]MBA5588886.1 hypothetical protein [Anaerobacillus isosaccharinicus]QOY37696.1 hypothetical protein AWH56_008985 [Anaerobacillus isosaccharinicus]